MNDNELQFILKMQDQASGTLRAFNSSVSGLSGTIQQQIAAMNQLTGALNNHAGASQKSAAASHAHAAAHHAAAEGAKEEAEAELSLGRALERVANQAKEAAEALVGLWASNEMARSTVEAAEEAENALRKIARASGESMEAIKELHEELAKLSLNNGNATIDQLEHMAEAAARMGAKKEQMSEFAETISKISNGGNFQQMTQGISKILQATGEGAEGVEKLGDALAAMEKHSTQGIEGLIPLMERLAGSTGALGISSEHLAAYAATIEKLGGRPEMAVMAFERTMQQLKQTAQNGGQALYLLSAQANMTAEDFRKFAQTKPEEAFQKVLAAVKQLQDQGKDPGNFLSRLGIGDEQSAAIEQMAKHLKDLTANLNLADNSHGEADKLAEQLKTEFTRALNEMTTAWTEFKATVGDDVVQAAVVAFHAASSAIQALTGFLQALTPEMRGFLEAVVIGMPAVLGLTKIIGAILEAASGALETLGRIGVSVVGKAEATGHGVNAAEEAMVAKSASAWGSWARIALSSISLVAAEIELYRQSSVLADQWSGFAQKGVGNGSKSAALGDIALAYGGLLPSALGGDYFKSKLTGRLQGEKDAGGKLDFGGEKKPEGEEHRESESHSPADKADRDAAAQAQDVVNQKMKEALNTLDEYRKKAEDLRAVQDALSQAERNAAEGSTEYSQKELHLMQQRLDMMKAMNEPLFAEARAQSDALVKAMAYTKVQQDRLAIEMEIRKLEEEGKLDASAPNDADHNKVRSDMGAAQAAERAKSFNETLTAMNNQLALAGALTQADKNRLDIDQQIAALAKDKGFGADQLAQLQAILEKTKEVETEMGQFKQLNPQATALIGYNEQLQILNQRLRDGSVNAAEFAREKAKLDQDTLAARDPVGAIVQSQQDEIAQLGIVGKYREADLKTLEEITKLQREGVLDGSAQSKAIESQIGANNRMVQDLKDAQKELDDLTQSFSQGLSSAIGQALSGQKYAFQKAAAAFGQKLLDMGVNNIVKAMEPNLQGMLGGMFGQAKAGTNALSDMAKKQMEQTITTASATITASYVTVNGAIAGSAAATAAGVSGGDVQSIASTGMAGDASHGAGIAKLKEFMGGDAPGNTSSRSFPPAMKPYDPDATLESQYGPGVQGMFGDKLSDGIGITDWRVKMAHPEINGDAIQKGLGDGLKRLGDSLGITKNGKYVAPAPHPDFQQPGAGGGASGALGQVQGLSGGGGDRGGVPLPPVRTSDLGSPFGNLDAAKAAFESHSAAFANTKGSFYYQARMHETADQNIVNSNGGAAGYYQFMPGTWAGLRAQHPELDLPTYTTDATKEQQTAAYQEFTKGNVNALQANDIPITDKNVFMSSFLGSGGASKFIKQMNADPNQTAASLFPREARQNHGDFYDKNGNPLSLQGVYDKETKNFQTGNTTGFGRNNSLYSNDGVGLPHSGTGPGIDRMQTGAIKTPDTSAMQNAMQQAQQVQSQLKQSLTASSSTFQSSFSSLSQNITKTGQSALSAVPDMGSFSNSISEMVSKLGSGGGGGGFGSLFGGGGFGGGFGDFDAFHAGGIVGSTFGSRLMRSVNPTIFRGAPKFHDGLTDDEFPAILQRGERVLTQSQDARNTATMQRLADQVASQSSQAGAEKPGARERSSPRITFNVSTPNASSFRYSQSQIMASAHASLNRAASRHN